VTVSTNHFGHKSSLFRFSLEPQKMHALAIMKLRLTKAVFGEEHSGSSAFHGRDEYSLSGKNNPFWPIRSVRFRDVVSSTGQNHNCGADGGLGVELAVVLLWRDARPPVQRLVIGHIQKETPSLP
jgi:hypothetical protein